MLIIMRPITDHVTAVTSDTQDFTNKWLCMVREFVDDRSTKVPNHHRCFSLFRWPGPKCGRFVCEMHKSL